MAEPIRYVWGRGSRWPASIAEEGCPSIVETYIPRDGRLIIRLNIDEQPRQLLCLCSWAGGEAAHAVVANGGGSRSRHATLRKSNAESTRSEADIASWNELWRSQSEDRCRFDASSAKDSQFEQFKTLCTR